MIIIIIVINKTSAPSLGFKTRSKKWIFGTVEVIFFKKYHKKVKEKRKGNERNWALLIFQKKPSFLPSLPPAWLPVIPWGPSSRLTISHFLLCKRWERACLCLFMNPFYVVTYKYTFLPQLGGEWQLYSYIDSNNSKPSANLPNIHSSFLAVATCIPTADIWCISENRLLNRPTLVTRSAREKLSRLTVLLTFPSSLRHFFSGFTGTNSGLRGFNAWFP